MKKWLFLTSALLILAFLPGCAERAVQTTVPAGAESTAQTTAATVSSETESMSSAETETETETETVTEPETEPETDAEQNEHMEHIQLELRYGAVTGRVSLDQELFETHMGDIGKSVAGNEGELSEVQMRILDSCASTPAAAAHYCAAWISSVFDNAGIYGVGGNANDMWENICDTDDLALLEPGMVIAVQHSRTDEDSDGYIYGHVGIYIGNGYVIHSTTVEGEGTKVITSLDDWLDRYDPYDTVKWGYPYF